MYIILLLFYCIITQLVIIDPINVKYCYNNYKNVPHKCVQYQNIYFTRSINDFLKMSVTKMCSSRNDFLMCVSVCHEYVSYQEIIFTKCVYPYVSNISDIRTYTFCKYYFLI